MREDAAQRRSERVSRGAVVQQSTSEHTRPQKSKHLSSDGLHEGGSSSGRLHRRRSNSADSESPPVPSKDRLSLRKRRSLLAQRKVENGPVCNGHKESDTTDESEAEVTFSPRVHRSNARFPRTSSTPTRTQGVGYAERYKTSISSTPGSNQKEKTVPKTKSEYEMVNGCDEEEEPTFSPRVHRSRNRFPRTSYNKRSSPAAALDLSDEASHSVASDKELHRSFKMPPVCEEDVNAASERIEVKEEEVQEMPTTEDEETEGLLTEGDTENNEDVDSQSDKGKVVERKSDLETDDEVIVPPRRRSGRLVGRRSQKSPAGKETTKLTPFFRKQRPQRRTSEDDAGFGDQESDSDEDGPSRDHPRRSSRIVELSLRSFGPVPAIQKEEVEVKVEEEEEVKESGCGALPDLESEAEIDFSQWVSPRRSTRIVMQRSRVETGPPPELVTVASTSSAAAPTPEDVPEPSKSTEKENEDEEEAPDSPYEAPRLRKRRRSSTADSRMGDIETSSSASTVAAISSEPPPKRRRCGSRRADTFSKRDAISEDDEEAEEAEEVEESEDASEASSVQAMKQKVAAPRSKKDSKKSKKKENDDENKTEYYEFQRLYVNSLLRRDPVCVTCERMGPPEEVLTCTNGCQQSLHLACAEVRLRELVNSAQPPTLEKEDEVVDAVLSTAPTPTSSEAPESVVEEKNKEGAPAIPAESESDQPKLDERPESFKCPECLLGRRRCFMCKDEQSPNSAPLIRCDVASCGHLYHEACLRAMTFTRQENRRLICPTHLCHACAVDNPASRSVRIGRMIRCIRCPVTYHAGDFCVAAGSVELSGNLIICPNHYEAALFKRNRTINVLWCLICSKGGSLICCEKCPASFHTDCIDVDGESVPEKFVCDDCLQGRNPRYGEIVWAKVGHFRWWPCEVLHSRNAPKNILRLAHYPGQFPVHFFGSDEYCWMHRGRVFSFEDGDYAELRSSDESSNNRLKRWYAKGIKKAVRAFAAWREDREEKESKQDNKKPYPYRYIKNNYPIGNVKVHKPGELHELPRCDCNPNRTGGGGGPCSSDSECLNRMLMYECHPSTCRAGDRCENQRFVKRQYPTQEIFRTTDNRGWGLVAAVDIKKGEFVNEYVGDLIDEEEAMKRLQQAHESNVTNYYMLTLDRTRIIDAGPKGNLSRFMNHSCSPSLETQKWLVNGDFRIGLFAARDIKKGEELTFNYNFQSLGDEQCVCRCGSESCIGFLGAPTQSQAEKQLQEQEQESTPVTKQKQQQVQQKQKQKQQPAQTQQKQKQQQQRQQPQQSQQKQKQQQSQQKLKQQQQPQQRQKQQEQSQQKSRSKSRERRLQERMKRPWKRNTAIGKNKVQHRSKVKHPRILQNKKKQQMLSQQQQRSSRRSSSLPKSSSADLQSSCSSSEADSSGSVDPPMSRRKSEQKMRRDRAESCIMSDENICFRCGEGGRTMCCDADLCPKAYHLACLGLDKAPNGKWFCPWHHCDYCGRAATVLCRDCTTSYCELHAESDSVPPILPLGDNSGLVLCADHQPTPSDSTAGSVTGAPESEEIGKGKENTTPPRSGPSTASPSSRAQTVRS